jgi:hypothetical protein
MRYPDKAKALVDYAGILGVAHLRDGAGRVIASSYPLPPRALRHSDDGYVFRLPGAACREPGRHELNYGGYTLSIIAAAGLSPRSVKERLDNCMRLLRALANDLTSFVPPDPGGGGAGPANSELRVWPPLVAPRRRS